MTPPTPASAPPIHTVPITDDTTLMVWRATPDGACTYLNPAWLRFTGRPLAEGLGGGWLDSLHDDDRGACVSEWRQAFESRRGFSLEFRVRRADGVYRSVVSVGAPRFDSQGELEGFDGACADITDQITADGHFSADTEERLRLHANYTAEAVYRIRLQPTRAVEYISASVHRLTGRSPEEYYDLYRRPELAKELLVPEDQPKALALMAEPEAAPPIVVLRWKHADGRILWIEHQRTPIRDAAGTLVAVVGVARDVTRQKMLERQEHQQAALLFTLVSHFDATLVEGPDGQTILSNAAFSRLFAETGEPPGTAAVREPSPDSARTREIRQRAEPSSGRVRWPDGRVFERDYVPVRADGVLVAHMWRYIDVTDKVRSETAWFESKARLRDLAVHAEQVRETERRHLARMLHDDIGQAFTSIRMELATAITRFRETAVPGQIDLVDRLQHAAGLVDLGLVTVRRISTSLRPPVLDHLGLVAGIQWEASEFERRWNIRCRVTALPKEFELDRDRSTAVYRILLEALNNVARHSKAGAVRIALLRRAGTLLLKVEDNGCGVAAADVANPRTMGLLGMRERALPFGGDVRIGSAPRGGTRVLAIIPL